jgi:proteasome lid subunit RPN8/RPN11
MTVHRVTPLLVAASRGQLIVASQVLSPTRAALQASCDLDGPHEGLVLWLGRVVGASTLVLAATVPETDHGSRHVMCDEHAVGAAARTAHAASLGVIAQVHSHPGGDTRHSDGDDRLVLMPFDGMFSLVVAEYGLGDLLPPSAGLHQYQDGRWVQVNNPDALIVVPGQLGREVRP